MHIDAANLFILHAVNRNQTQHPLGTVRPPLAHTLSLYLSSSLSALHSLNAGSSQFCSLIQLQLIKN